ncbi:hypothetical protein [Anaerotignum sp. MB30-C6]|uniref:hypothetical protein n=1 Tax=Anaerotignum sp. MB30-C6 TaxID=3070814 RepID=UPI0027DDBC9B|nr:hypothetical protein [Anaerotignum sp. MB30-C6]WMI81323.1 hypothetical protein RBQ60_00910 [Anaerotignum sp. MB30-C6]
MNKKDKLLLVFLGFCVVVAFVGGQVLNSRKAFTTEKWVNYEGNSRQAIVKDFLDRNIIEGLSEEELVGYLGEPNEKREEALLYYLGTPKGFFGINKDGEEEYLIFHFEDGKAKGFKRVPGSALELE